jgi:hypothetical protein
VAVNGILLLSACGCRAADNASIKRKPAPTRLRSAPKTFSTYKKAAAPNGAAAFAFAMIKQKT